MDVEEMANATEIAVKYAVKSAKLETWVKVKDMKTLEEVLKYLELNLEK